MDHHDFHSIQIEVNCYVSGLITNNSRLISWATCMMWYVQFSVSGLRSIWAWISHIYPVVLLRSVLDLKQQSSPITIGSYELVVIFWNWKVGFESCGKVYKTSSALLFGWWSGHCIRLIYCWVSTQQFGCWRNLVQNQHQTVKGDVYVIFVKCL
jgi:hypothetical protein